MPAQRRIAIVIPELPVVDVAALAAEVVEQPVAPVVVPGAPGVDVDLGVAVGVVAEAVAEGTLGPVGALFDTRRGGGGLGGGGGEGAHEEEIECGLGDPHFDDNW